MKTIYRTVIAFEILSEEPLNGNVGKSLAQIAYDTTEGEMSGRFLNDIESDTPLTGADAVAAIKEQGCDTEFFNLDDEGNDLDGDDEDFPNTRFRDEDDDDDEDEQ